LGGYGNYFSFPDRQLFHLPDSIPFTEGAIIADAVVAAVHAVTQALI
jgi:D-arabinose 1-dehydrogenase-like Zn-dependent alcohol dehydrogenase